MDKKIAAERIRARLENRLAKFLACDAKDLPALRLGELVHLSFMLWGDGEEMGGFNPTTHAIVEIVGREIMWELPKTEGTEETEETETPKAEIVIN
jgi:hypothetical protein